MSKNFELLKLLQENGKSGGARLPAAKDFSEYLPGRKWEKSRRVRETNSQDWIRAIFILQKHWRLSALFAICVFCGTAIATFVTKPVYEPSVTLEIDPPGTQAFIMERGSGDENDAEYLETQAKMLDSDELALGVIRKLHLDEDRDFVNTSKPNRNLGDTAHANEMTAWLASRENAALTTFRTRLKVQRDTSSRLITVSFASHDPRTAAQVANELVSEFNENNFKTLHEAIMQTSAWLSRQLDDIRAKMDQSSRALVEFQQRTGIADLDANKSTLADQMSGLDQQLVSARGDRIQLEAQLARAKDGSPESLPQSGNNPLIQNLLQKLAEARTELSQVQVEYGKNHPTVKKLQSEVDQLQTELDSQKRRIFEQVQTSYAAAQSREHLLESERKLTTKQLVEMAQYASLKKDFQTETDLYNTLYARVKEAGITAASNANNVRVIDHARVLQHPTRPRILLNLAFGLLAAVFGGVTLAFVREALDTRIHSSEDIMNATGIPSVSVLPMIGEYAEPGAAVVPRLKGGTNGHGSVSKFLLEEPSSAEAEALRSLYTTVMLSCGGRPPQVLLVVSGSSGEGKTTIASNLAIALAQRGPTCLVDADLRRGAVSRTFGLYSSSGLASVLSGSAELLDVITPSQDVPRLSIVPAGTADRNPGELMAHQSVDRVVSALRERFEFVVFDSPPILPFAEGRVLSTLVDGLILVGRYRATTRAAIAKTIDLLSAIHAAPILEVVLNGTSTIADSEYYGYQY